ncbi:MAG TPA: class I SAM-dependent methyltransferase, partial [Gemmatimonadaceae bacterium]|nr:class I SAM-dependent methyltransferase [Gemmatimonadaceae bacterium]
MSDMLHQPRRVLRALRRLATDPSYASAWAIRLRRPPGTFQPSNHTVPNRYPVIFRRAAHALQDRKQPRILSFGCSVGDELFSLRAYFPDAFITGIDINRWNVVLCRIRLARARDRRIRVAVGSSTTSEPAESYDA